MEKFQSLIKSLENQKVSENEDSSEAEVAEEVTEFCIRRINELSSNSVTNLTQSHLVGQKRDIQEEKLLKFSEKEPIRESVESEPADPLRFLAKWKHLDGKTVSFETKDGEVSGTVRGLVTPDVIVVTSNGYNVKVAPTKLRVK